MKKTSLSIILAAAFVVTHAQTIPQPGPLDTVGVNSTVTQVATATDVPTVHFVLDPGTPPTPGNWFNSAQAFFGSFDTNSTTFESHKFRGILGADYQDNVNVDSSISVEWIPFAHIGFEGTVRNASVAGTIVSAQAGPGIFIDHADVEVGAFIDAGYSPLLSKPFGAVALQISKAATANTFIGTRLETQFYSRKPEKPLVGIFAGVTF